MALTHILFDLDGTLLPMDQDVFVHSYMKRLAHRMAPLGYDPNKLVKAIWDGTAAMVKNDGSRTNEAAFWSRFAELFGKEALNDLPAFEEFYRTDFQQVAADCGQNPAAARTVEALKNEGYTLVLATNPLFPSIATESRIRWAGLTPEQFLFYTSYENTSYCKPNPDYYRDILARLGCAPENCLMVGNDVEEDMIAETVGMQVFLLTDCLIHRGNTDLDRFPRGSFDALMAFIRAQASA